MNSKRPSATVEGTKKYWSRFTTSVASSHIRQSLGVLIGSIGLGTYLGNPDDETDSMYEEALQTALSMGTNVIDTAANYRFQRSEKTVGRTLKQLFNAGVFTRDEIFVSSKAGFIPYEGSAPIDPEEYLRRVFLQTKIIQSSDLVAGCHCLAPQYLMHQLEQSLNNLQLECIDLYYLHNPETQLLEIVPDEFNHRMLDAFATLEESVSTGRIRYYGTATWNGYRLRPGARDLLSLPELLSLAEQAGGKDHRFRAIQLPVNLAMPEAFTRQNQNDNETWRPVLNVAEDNGMMVMASGSISQGSLTRDLPRDLREVLGQNTDAQNAIQFVRSTPGVTTALVGMKDSAHVRENLALAAVDPLPEHQYMRLFARVE
ncbi:MAG TPA: aldo/keto reductase [Acidobacteriota bacterium]|jgi:aryl-alcohol dehydrogenase-like predicted oxidoreductase